MNHAVCNIAASLSQMAQAVPQLPAVIAPAGREGARARAGREADYKSVLLGPDGRAKYVEWTFEELERASDRFALGLASAGIGRGCRVLFMVRPGLDFIGLTFAFFKLGAVPILIDPGMGRSNLISCIRDAEPAAMVAIPIAHAVRVLFRHRLPPIQTLVTVGRRWFWGGKTLRELTANVSGTFSVAQTASTDPAAIIFTSGSTGPPKGVVYEHGMFAAQVELLRAFYQIEPGGRDVAAFPLFALFNAALGVTTIIPDMDASRPATVDPARFLQGIDDHQATQSFASPAVWRRVSDYCIKQGKTLPTMNRILMAGAPVRTELAVAAQSILPPNAAAHTPYGATEALPVASIDSHEIIAATAEKTRNGAGTCVGRPFPQMTVRIIRIDDGPIEQWRDDLCVPAGIIGEIVVKGPVVTREYFRREAATRRAKIADGEGFWHRMGDAGYFDGEGRLWFCGRVSHRVRTKAGDMFTDGCEAIFNQHPKVARSALVGIRAAMDQTPVICIEPHEASFPRGAAERTRLSDELLSLAKQSPLTASIRHVLFHRSFPVDVRHNAKIFREQLAVWAAKELRGRVG